MVQNENSVITKRKFAHYLLLSFLFCVIPFLIRLFLLDGRTIEKPNPEYNFKVIEDVTGHLLINDRLSVFYLIFKNNLKVCIINIAGGAMFGLVTVSNLIWNGFYAADVFATIHFNGMSIIKILKHTMPHSFELLGIWLSGALGFCQAKLLILYMKGKELHIVGFLLFAIKCFLIIITIILLSAFIETFISIPFAK